MAGSKYAILLDFLRIKGMYNDSKSWQAYLQKRSKTYLAGSYLRKACGGISCSGFLSMANKST